MKIGVVCEGLTDFHAINYYVGAALLKRGVSSEFVALQPLPDNTSGGGWSYVFTWLDQNPPKAREQLFGRGLFANSKKFSGLDSIVIHLDTDILPEKSFLNFLKARDIKMGATNTLAQKGAELSGLISIFAHLDDCQEEYAKKHVPAPIAESSEAWCVAVDSEFGGSAESLSGQNLIDAFGVAFARFNKNEPKKNYRSINKRTKSRENYCKTTAEEVDRLNTCTLFVSLVENLALIAPRAA